MAARGKRPASRAPLIDRLLRSVGLARATGGVQVRGVYAAAAHNRLTADWYTSILSADQELKGDLRRLRGASRALVRDDPHASRFVNLLAENVSGHQGIQLKGQFVVEARGANGQPRLKPDTARNRELEWAWYDWQFPEHADAAGQLSWVDLQCLLLRNLPADGEVLARLLPGIDNAHGFAVQVIDPDLLDETLNVAPEKNPGGTGNEIRMGVEVAGSYAKPVAYWLWTSHPSDAERAQRRERVRVPADQIIHWFVRARPGQTRGVPWFAPVLLRHKMLGCYEEAEVTAARIGASNMAAVAYDPDKAGPPPLDLTGNGSADGSAGAVPGQSAIPMEVEPGRFLRLGPGETLVGTKFDHPSTAYAPFTLAVLRSIASGLNVSYAALTGDLSNANYSSDRAGRLSERDFYRGAQTGFATHVCRRVYRAWVPMAMLAGHLPVRPAREYDRVAWKPRGWDWVDPVKDITAAAMSVREGFTTRATICAQRGEDFEDNLEQLAAESELAEQYGVTLGGALGDTPGGEEGEDDEKAEQQQKADEDREALRTLTALVQREDAARSRRADERADEQLALARQAVEVARAQKAATEWLASRETPAPVVNVDVAAPEVRVDVPAPVVTVHAPVTVEQRPMRRVAEITKADGSVNRMEVTEEPIAEPAPDEAAAPAAAEVES